MDRGAWEPGRLQFLGVTKSPTQLSNLAAAEHLVYNIELIFSVQRSDSLCIYILFIFFSIMVSHRILITVTCALQRTLLFILNSFFKLCLILSNISHETMGLRCFFF